MTLEPNSNRLQFSEVHHTSSQLSKRGMTTFISLGGCMTHEVAGMCSSFYAKHLSHSWRRPTIALVSEPHGIDVSLPSTIDLAFRRYWDSDLKKAHLMSILQRNTDFILTDLIRDVRYSFIEISTGSFVLDPMSVKGLMWNGSENKSDFDLILGKNYEQIDLSHKIYMDLWKASFDNFAALVEQSSIRNIVISKFFLTGKLASVALTSFGDAAYIDFVNSRLREMYGHIAKNHPSIEMIDIPDRAFSSGKEALWGGPSPVHYHSETIALFAEQVAQVLIGDRHKSGHSFIDVALRRLGEYEDALRLIGRLEKTVASLEKKTLRLKKRVTSLEKTKPPGGTP